MLDNIGNAAVEKLMMEGSRRITMLGRSGVFISRHDHSREVPMKNKTSHDEGYTKISSSHQPYLRQSQPQQGLGPTPAPNTNGALHYYHDHQTPFPLDNHQQFYTVPPQVGYVGSLPGQPGVFFDGHVPLPPSGNYNGLSQESHNGYAPGPLQGNYTQGGYNVYAPGPPQGSYNDSVPGLQGSYNTHVPGPLQGGYNGNFPEPLQGGYNGDSPGPLQGAYNSNEPGPLQGGYKSNVPGPLQGNYNGDAPGPQLGGYDSNAPGLLQGGYNSYAPAPTQGGYNGYAPRPLQGGYNGDAHGPLQGGYHDHVIGPPQGGYNSNVPGQLQGGHHGHVNGPPQGSFHEYVPGAMQRCYNGNFPGQSQGDYGKGHASQHFSSTSRSINGVRGDAQNRRNTQPRSFREHIPNPSQAQRIVSTKQEVAFTRTNNVVLQNLPKDVTPQIITESLKGHNLVVKQCTIELNAEKDIMVGRVEFQNSTEASTCCQLASNRELKCGDQIIAASLARSNSSIHRGQNKHLTHRESRRFIPY